MDKSFKKQMKCKNSGITLIALIVTIIIILILAGVSIMMLAGDNSVLNRATDASTKTEHASVLEALLLEQNNYIIQKTTGETTKTLIEYLQSKSIIGNEIGTNSGKYQVNTANLGISAKYGKGTATESEKQDVYMLKKADITTGKMINTKVASTTPIRIASTTSNNVTYNFIYYGASTSEPLNLGVLSAQETDDLAKLKEYFVGKGENDFWNNTNDTFIDKEPITDASTTIIFWGPSNVGFYIKYGNKYYLLTSDEDSGLVANVEQVDTLTLYFVGKEKSDFWDYNTETFIDKEPILDASTAIIKIGDGNIPRYIKYDNKYYMLRWDGWTVIEVKQIETVNAEIKTVDGKIEITTPEGITYTEDEYSTGTDSETGKTVYRIPCGNYRDDFYDSNGVYLWTELSPN